MNRWLARVCILPLLLILSAFIAAGEEPSSKATTQPTFTADAYLAHVKYLASDELEGRAPGTQGSAKAADYIIEQFKQAGCEPGGVDGSWCQPFEIQQGKQLVDEKALLEIAGIDHKWQVRKDWVPFPFTAVEDVEGPLAFAGYGVDASRFEYNDYAGFDADGKVLLIFRYEPQDKDRNASFGGETPSRHAFFRRKAILAASNGAKALLVVTPPGRDPGGEELYEFDSSFDMQTYSLPMVHITRAMAAVILEKAGMPALEELQQKLDTERKPLSQDMGLNVRIRPGVEPKTLPGKNVLGFFHGDGTTEDTIVVGAHRDHLGIVPRRGQRDDMTPLIHNGADDNAAGTAAVIELARAIAGGPRLHRNVLFIAFDGEEMGLLGSRHYVSDPTIPLGHIRAMINFDMIGRLKQDKYTVFGTGTAAEFPDLIKKYAELVDLKYTAPRGMAGGSDHTPFARREVPALFAFTGLHKEYHYPEDDWELIDADGAARILQMWYPIIVELANMEDGPAYTEPTAEASEEEQEQAPKPAAEEQEEAAAREAEKSDEPRSQSDVRVRLGIIPDLVGGDEPGLVVEAAVAGSCAKAAGMQDGDRIVRIADEDIRDIYGYMHALKRFKPGDQVDVVVVRDGEKKTLKVTLESSRK